MQHSTKQKALLAFVVASLIFYVCTFLLTTNTVTNVSAVDSYGVGVYWNQTCRETEKVKNIAWGDLSPGSVKNVSVYIRNEEAEPMYLNLSTTNWNPPEASEYLNLGCDYEWRRMDPGKVLQITLTLSVDRYIEGISNFSFDIIITGRVNFPGDINGDGFVGAGDLGLLGWAWGSTIGEPNYMPEADLNGDGVIGAGDLGILGAHWGETA